MDHEEFGYVDLLSEKELVDFFIDGLISRATGLFFDDQDYSLARKKLIENQILNDLLPDWVKAKRTLDLFWTFIKGRYGTYAERREFIWNEFEPILAYLDSRPMSTLETNIVFDESYIHSIWQKALDRKTIEPDGAITLARTLIESVLKHILDEQKIDFNDSAELPELYKEVAKSLNLAPENHQEQIFKQILSGVISIVYGLGTLRNKLGDAHGKSKRSVKPAQRHSELAVNLAGAVAIFLLRTLKENNGPSEK